MANWFKQQGTVQAGYTLSGQPLGNYFTPFFTSPVGISAMLQASHQTFLNNIYDSVRTAFRTSYYEDSVNLQCLIVLTGNWWDPTL